METGRGLFSNSKGSLKVGLGTLLISLLPTQPNCTEKCKKLAETRPRRPGIPARAPYARPRNIAFLKCRRRPRVQSRVHHVRCLRWAASKSRPFVPPSDLRRARLDSPRVCADRESDCCIRRRTDIHETIYTRMDDRQVASAQIST